MTDRERFEASEQKLALIERAGGMCDVCGASLTHPQLAHRIPKFKRYLKRWGKAVIHHPLNLVVVCSLRCNSAVLLDPATNPIEAEKLIGKILENINNKC
jgi:hypothetical protein